MTTEILSDCEGLLHVAAQFCNPFACLYAMEAILNYFSTRTEPSALEHGLPQLAPFLGQSFKGLDGIKEYFMLTDENLLSKDMGFVDYIVDVETSKRQESPLEVRNRSRGR